MAKARTLVGLDVHATKIVAAVLDAETGELQCFTLSGDVSEAAGLCAGLPRPVRATYEAGPTGYGLARELARRGVECVVAAPSKIPRAAGDRVKTDRRDAEHLVRLLLAGKLHPVRVPGPEEEALRDLVRAREAVRADLMRCRHRLSKLLLRHGMRFDDGQAWTQRHRDWLAEVALAWPAAQATMLDAQGAIDALAHRRGALDREIVALLPTSPWAGHVARLRFNSLVALANYSMAIAAAFGALASRLRDRRFTLLVATITLFALPVHHQMSDWGHFVAVPLGFVTDRLAATPARAASSSTR